jgi:uncharacterized protein YkwD
MTKSILKYTVLLVAILAMSMSYIDDNAIMLSKVNKIRAEGCYCGRRWMEPVGPLVWSETLSKSALAHAKDMHTHNFFAHYSHQGKDIGQRLDAFNYNWQYVGENIGEGQKTFDEVLQDWLISKPHCKMLMNENMKEMAVTSYKQYWVQHFGTQLSPKKVEQRSK